MHSPLPERGVIVMVDEHSETQHSSASQHLTTLTPAVCDALIVGAVREALDEFQRRMNGLIYNGAGDPEQEFYDRGVAPWLEREMGRVRRTLSEPEALRP
jgi:hypothetical protein